MHDEAKAMDRFRQEQSRTPLTAQQQRQIVHDILLDLVSFAREALQDSLPAPSLGL